MSKDGEHCGEACETSWASTNSTRIELRTIRDTLAPTDAVTLNVWLFDHHPHLPGISVENGFEAFDAELRRRRLGALNDVIQDTGIEGIMRLARSVPAPEAVGWLLGNEGIVQADELAICEAIVDENQATRQCAGSFVAGAFARWGQEFLQAALDHGAHSLLLAVRAIGMGLDRLAS
jgi:hypothetical protein